MSVPEYEYKCSNGGQIVKELFFFFLTKDVEEGFLCFLFYGAGCIRKYIVLYNLCIYSLKYMGYIHTRTYMSK